LCPTTNIYQKQKQFLWKNLSGFVPPQKQGFKNKRNSFEKNPPKILNPTKLGLSKNKDFEIYKI